MTRYNSMGLGGKLTVSTESNNLGSVTKTDVANAEKQLGLRFKQVYVDYLLTPKEDGDHEYIGLANNGNSNNIVKVMQTLLDYGNYPSDALPLAAVGNGDYYVFNNTTGKIGYYSHVNGDTYPNEKWAKSLTAFAEFAFN